MAEIQVIAAELDEIMNTDDVVAETGVSYDKALAAMSLNVIPSRRVNSYVTLRKIFEMNKHKLVKAR